VSVESRILEALRAAGGTLDVHTLGMRVFPIDDYPRAWNYRARGGPPACAMTLRKALNRMERDGLLYAHSRGVTLTKRGGA